MLSFYVPFYLALFLLSFVLLFYCIVSSVFINCFMFHVCFNVCVFNVLSSFCINIHFTVLFVFLIVSCFTVFYLLTWFIINLYYIYLVYWTPDCKEETITKWEPPTMTGDSSLFQSRWLLAQLRIRTRLSSAYITRTDLYILAPNTYTTHTHYTYTLSLLSTQLVFYTIILLPYTLRSHTLIKWVVAVTPIYISCEE